MESFSLTHGHLHTGHLSHHFFFLTSDQQLGPYSCNYYNQQVQCVLTSISCTLVTWNSNFPLVTNYKTTEGYNQTHFSQLTTGCPIKTDYNSNWLFFIHHLMHVGPRSYKLTASHLTKKPSSLCSQLFYKKSCKQLHQCTEL